MIKKFIFILLVLSLLIIPISADSFEETYTDIWSDSTSTTSISIGHPTTTCNYVIFPQYTTPIKYKDLYFISYTGSPCSITGGSENINYDFVVKNSVGNICFAGVASYDNDYNALGNPVNGYMWFHVNSIFYENCSAYYIGNTISFYSGGVLKSSSVTLETGTGGDVGTNTDLGLVMFIGTQTSLYGVTCYYNYDWETTVSGTYNTEFSDISVQRRGFTSNFTVYDIDGNKIRSDIDYHDFEYELMYDSYRYVLTNGIGSIFEKTLIGGYESSFSLTKSKEVPIAIKENIYVYLNGLISFTPLNRIIWNIDSVDSEYNTITGEQYTYNYVRYNDTYWYYTDAYNDKYQQSGYIAESSLTKQIQQSFNETGYKRVSCNLFNNDMNIIGNPEIIIEVGDDLGQYLQYFIRTVDTSTNNGLSGCELNIYYIDESGEHLDQTITMSGSQEEIILEIGKIYKIYASKIGYSTETFQFTALQGKTFTMYLTQSSDLGYSSLTFIVTDKDYNRLQYASINIGGDIEFTNIAGITAYKNMLTGETYNYTVSLAGYVSQTGSIYADNETEQINIYLYKESDIYPTPTPTNPLPQNPSDFNPIQTFIYCIMLLGCNYETASLVVGCAIVFMAFGMGANTIGLFGGIFTGCIGLVMAIGLALLPFYLFYIFILCASLIIAYRLKF
jgi:hypothetical protein